MKATSTDKHCLLANSMHAHCNASACTLNMVEANAGGAHAHANNVCKKTHQTNRPTRGGSQARPRSAEKNRRPRRRVVRVRRARESSAAARARVAAPARSAASAAAGARRSAARGCATGRRAPRACRRSTRMMGMRVFVSVSVCGSDRG